MVYSRYFSTLVRKGRLPELGSADITRWMNIIFHEGKMEALYQMRTNVSCPELEKKLEQLNAELVDLTGGMKPSDLFQSMKVIESSLMKG